MYINVVMTNEVEIKKVMITANVFSVLSPTQHGGAIATMAATKAPTIINKTSINKWINPINLLQNGGPCWFRTSDQSVMSQPLYH